MRFNRRLVVVLVCLLVSAGAAAYRAQTAPDLVSATRTFLAALSAEQAATARFDFNDAERFNWAFIPRERNGLPLKEMEPHQQALAHTMMSAALGYRGMMKATTIMSLEQVLREIEGPNGRFNRDPELYYFSVFGEPSDAGTWGWRLEGHHIAVNVTMTDGRFAASSPTFLGSNPAVVREGPRQGLRALDREEDLGRQLLQALDAGQRDVAVLPINAPNEIITGNSRRASLEGGPAGLAAARMNATQRELLLAVIREYTGRMATGPEVQARIERELDGVHFAWAGSADIGAPHYYRVHGPSFLIEYDNVQNGANHVHSVFRDFENDFGDALLAHYQASHGLELAD